MSIAGVPERRIWAAAAGRLFERTGGSDLAEWVGLLRYLCPVLAGWHPSDTAATER
jgi:hypothetical protein